MLSEENTRVKGSAGGGAELSSSWFIRPLSDLRSELFPFNIISNYYNLNKNIYVPNSEQLIIYDILLVINHLLYTITIIKKKKNSS